MIKTLQQIYKYLRLFAIACLSVLIFFMMLFTVFSIIEQNLIKLIVFLFLLYVCCAGWEICVFGFNEFINDIDRGQTAKLFKLNK